MWRVVGWLLLLTALTSCSGQRIVEQDGYTLYLHRESLLPRGGETAEIGGALVVHEGCVGLESGENYPFIPVVWPAGTSIASTDPFAIRLPSGELLSLGEFVMGGGGFHSPEGLGLEIPAECLPETNEVAVFNPDDNPTKS